MQYRAKHQGGIATSFIIIGIVLVVAVLAVVYFLKTHPDMFKGDNGATTSQSQPQSSPSKNQNTSDTKNNSSTNPSDDTTKNTDRSNDASKDSTASPDNVSNSKKSQSDDEKLPHTGPTETIASIVAVGLLAFATTAYLRSRRA